MPMTVDQLKARVKERIATDPSGNQRKRSIPNPDAENTYDSENGAPVELIEHEVGLDLTWELETIIDAVCEGVIEMCEEEGLLLGDTEATKVDVG